MTAHNGLYREALGGWYVSEDGGRTWNADLARVEEDCREYRRDPPTPPPAPTDPNRYRAEIDGTTVRLAVTLGTPERRVDLDASVEAGRMVTVEVGTVEVCGKIGPNGDLTDCYLGAWRWRSACRQAIRAWLLAGRPPRFVIQW